MEIIIMKKPALSLLQSLMEEQKRETPETLSIKAGRGPRGMQTSSTGCLGTWRGAREAILNWVLKDGIRRIIRMG